MSDRYIDYMECSRVGKKCIDVFWIELDRTRADTRRKLKSTLDDLKRVQAKVVRLRKILKQAQRRTQDKTICLTKKLNKETKKRIARDDISDDEWEDLKAEKRDKEFLASLSVSEF